MDNFTDNQPDDSIIKKVMVEQEEKTRSMLDPLIVVMDALAHLKEREREILVHRFGLTGTKKVTLEAIGKKFQVTRERVRQIESSAVKRLASHPTKDLHQLVKIINSYIVSMGGLVSLADLAEYLRVEKDQRREIELNALRLVMDVNHEAVALKKDDRLKPGWVSKKFDGQILLPTIGAVVKILDKSGKVMTEDDLWDDFSATEVYKQYESELTPLVVSGIMRVAAELGRVGDAAWGLSAWPTVVPKRIRDKVFLVLDQAGKPMHFRDIAATINHNYPGKPVLSRTVHNELIGDGRFVLVGRGIYALKTWGYQPGVVSDVVAGVLRSAGRPMTSDEITEEVLKVRQVRGNTVVANLQNKKLFRKVGKGMYTLVESD